MSSVLGAAVPDRAANELWWITMIEAALALFFGVTAVFWPQLTLATLVYLFSAFVLGLGFLQLLSGIMSIRTRSNWWVTVLLGIFCIAIGMYLVRHPLASFGTFVLLVGLLLIARGILDFIRVFTDRFATRNNVTKILMAILGAAAIIAGIFIMIQPIAGGIAFVWILGLYAIIYGALSMAIALDLRAALFESEVLEREYATASTQTEPTRTRGETARTGVRRRTRNKTGDQPA